MNEFLNHQPNEQIGFVNTGILTQHYYSVNAETGIVRFELTLIPGESTILKNCNVSYVITKQKFSCTDLELASFV